MEQILDRIKERIAQRDSPIKTIKGVAEAIGMSESGFYTMIKRGTVKQGTLLAIGDALQFELLNFNDEKEKHSKALTFGDEVLDRMNAEIHEIKQVFEEQLRAKDRQLQAKDTQIELLLGLLGKPEGVTVKPLSTSLSEFNGLFNSYRLSTGYGELLDPKPTNNAGGKVGGTPFSYAENTVKINEL